MRCTLLCILHNINVFVAKLETKYQTFIFIGIRMR